MVNRFTLADVALLISAPAFAGNYVVTCTTSCTALDGTTQPAGTVINRILADPTFNPGPGLSLQPDTGQAVYVPPAKPQTTISALAFIGRFTTAEQSALTTANPMWGLQIAAAGTVDVTDPRVIAGIDAGVKAGALTQSRMTQILNLAIASP